MITATRYFNQCFLHMLLCLLFSDYAAAQDVLSTGLSACDRNMRPELMRSRLISKEMHGDSLLLTIGFAENCSFRPDLRASFQNDTLFLFKKNLSESHAMCDCCFELTIALSGIPDTNFVLMMSGNELRQSRSPYVKLPDEYVAEYKSPLNRVNKDKLRIGLWRTYYENSDQVQIEIYYSETWDVPERMWFKFYDKDGNLKEVGIRLVRHGTVIVYDAEDYSKILKQANLSD